MHPILFTIGPITIYSYGVMLAYGCFGVHVFFKHGCQALQYLPGHRV